MLDSIVMRLLSFADMAEDAALRSPLVRWCVLWAAWQANALLRDFVENSARNPAGRHWSPVMMPAGFGTHPSDAQDLAASLRALALVVRAIAGQLSRLSFLHRGQACNEAGDGGGMHRVGLQRRANAAVSPVELRDTS